MSNLTVVHYFHMVLIVNASIIAHIYVTLLQYMQTTFW
jgi:hypothetical protein